MSGLARIGLVVFLGWAAGCGSAGPPYPLTGQVQFQGQAVPVGEIVLMPDPERGKRGPMVMTEFRDGRYEFRGERGHVGGAYVARLTGFDGRPGDAVGPVDPRGTPLFAEVVVPLDLPMGPASWDFALPRE
jgi:hypothetical protein